MAKSAAKKVTSKAPSKKPVLKNAAAKKATAKVSPMKGMSVDAWVKAKATGWQAGTVKQLLELVRKAAPSASIAIKWGQPVFTGNGPFAYVRVSKAHVTLGFWRGTELRDPKKQLEGTGDRMSHLKITSADQFDARAITGFVSEAVALNAAKGDPTKRAK